MMSFLAWCGLIAVVVLGAFFPRCIAAILGGVLFGGGAWWGLFASLCIIGFLIDACALDS
jgi:hypothetical protein